MPLPLASSAGGMTTPPPTRPWWWSPETRLAPSAVWLGPVSVGMPATRQRRRWSCCMR